MTMFKKLRKSRVIQKYLSVLPSSPASISSAFTSVAAPAATTSSSFSSSFKTSSSSNLINIPQEYVAFPKEFLSVGPPMTQNEALQMIMNTMTGSTNCSTTAFFLR
ncbi:hypothetical protein EDD11_010140 [Mortierella claussenii]|nr:hypothetical protein EDD11_010140 [Mortierella claussenii]